MKKFKAEGGREVARVPGKRWKIGPRMGVILVLCLLAAGELALRSMGLPNRVATVMHPSRGWVALPNQNLVSHGKSIHINRFGYRDGDWAEPGQGSDERTYRIAVLGDSVAFGPLVDQGNTFPEVLESLVSERNPEQKVEVMNFAFPGYCVEQMFSQYEDEVLAWKPDWVVLALNDTSHRPHYPTRGGGVVRRLLIRTALYQKWLEWTRFNAVHPAVVGGKSAQKTKGLRDLIYTEPFGKRGLQALDLMCEGIVALKAKQKTWGGDVLVLAVPQWKHMVHPENPRLAQSLAVWGQRSNIPVLDPLDAFLKRSKPALDALDTGGQTLRAKWTPDLPSDWLLQIPVESSWRDRLPFLIQDYEHLSPAGHSVIAEALLPLVGNGG